MSVLLLIVGLVLFIGLVVVHEYGHFIAARRNGVEVEEFGIFFPPRLYKKKTKGGWLFTINALPLGGFVRLKGEHDSDTAPGSFGAATVWVKTKIMAAGVVFNLITALVLFTIVGLIGMPRLIDNQFSVKSDTQLVSARTLISYVEPGSPADKAGLQPRDELRGFAQPGFSPVGLASAKDLKSITKSFAGKKVKVSYVRDGEHQVTELTLLTREVVEASRKTDKPKAYLGVVPNDFITERYTWSAPVAAVGFSAQLTAETFRGLGHALGGLGGTIAGIVTRNSEARQEGQAKASEKVGGPVAIFMTLKGGSSIGYEFILAIIAYISLALAIMNILPIPALDGGRLWLTLISRGLKRPLSPKTEENINAVGFFVLITLIVLITIVDVKRFF